MDKELQAEMAQLIKERGLKPIPVVLNSEGPISVTAFLGLLPKRFRRQFTMVGIVWVKEGSPPPES